MTTEDVTVQRGAVSSVQLRITRVCQRLKKQVTFSICNAASKPREDSLAVSLSLAVFV